MTGPIKVTIYSKTPENPYPHKELIEDDIIINITDRRGKVSVDIKKYKIRIPENGFFIIAEMLSKEYYSDKVVRIHGEYKNRLPGFSFSTTKKEEGFL